MSKKTEVAAKRLIFRVGGAERSAVSMYERRNGDVIIDTKPGPAHVGGEKGEINARIKGKHFSIHRSLDSNDGISVLKQTVDLEGTSSFSVFCMTSVIKSGINFCPLYTRLFPDLSDPHYAPSRKRSDPIFLCEFDPKRNTPMMVVFVAAPGKQFAPNAPVDFEIINIPFQYCSVVVLWKLLDFPSEKVGTINPSVTFDHRVIGGHRPDAPSVTIHRGGNENRVTQYFDLTRREFEDHLRGARRLTTGPSAIAWTE